MNLIDNKGFRCTFDYEIVGYNAAFTFVPHLSIQFHF